LRFHFTLQLLDCDHTPVLTTVNQSVTTATISKQNGLIRQNENLGFSSQPYNFEARHAILSK
jgi:hypothetical protein